jgi:hypothetical protein
MKSDIIDKKYFYETDYNKVVKHVSEIEKIIQKKNTATHLKEFYDLAFIYPEALFTSQFRKILSKNNHFGTTDFLLQIGIREMISKGTSDYLSSMILDWNLDIPELDDISQSVFYSVLNIMERVEGLSMVNRDKYLDKTLDILLRGNTFFFSGLYGRIFVHKYLLNFASKYKLGNVSQNIVSNLIFMIGKGLNLAAVHLGLSLVSEIFLNFHHIFQPKSANTKKEKTTNEKFMQLVFNSNCMTTVEQVLFFGGGNDFAEFTESIKTNTVTVIDNNSLETLEVKTHLNSTKITKDKKYDAKYGKGTYDFVISYNTNIYTPAGLDKLATYLTFENTSNLYVSDLDIVKKFIKNVLKTYSDKLTKEEIGAMFWYTSDHEWYHTNLKMRTGRQHTMTPNQIKQFNILKNLIEKTKTDTHMFLYRGISYYPEVDLPEEKVPGLMSTTKNSNVALKFRGRNPDCCLLKLLVPKGVSHFIVNNFSGYGSVTENKKERATSEAEVLLLGGSLRFIFAQTEEVLYTDTNEKFQNHNDKVYTKVYYKLYIPNGNYPKGIVFSIDTKADWYLAEMAIITALIEKFEAKKQYIKEYLEFNKNIGTCVTKYYNITNKSNNSFELIGYIMDYIKKFK